MKKYSIIYADPPWNYRDKAKAGKRGAEFKYPVMRLKDIHQLPVDKIAAENAVLFLWITMPFLESAIRVMRAWGFEYKTMGFTWIKRAKNGGVRWGMGNWTRANPEFCLIGTRGKPKRVSAGVHSVVETIPGRHSEKPEAVRDRIVELMGDIPRIELFARQTTPGWDVWGNEVESEVEL